MGHAGIGAELEGFHAIHAAQQAGRLTELIVEESRRTNRDVANLIERAKQSGVSVTTVDDVRSLAVTSAPQGLVGRARPLRTHPLEDLVDPAPCLLVVLDHLEDPHNVGAIARSAAAAGATGMVIPTRRSAPLGATAFKAAVGAFERLRLAPTSSTADAVRRLEELGVWTIGLAASGGESLFGLPLLAEPVALVVGAESRGLARLVEERVSVRARIPMSGQSESLNASVAAALALFEAARVRNKL